jgi:DNA repair exonuclease SbcCD ATPase subunit
LALFELSKVVCKPRNADGKDQNRDLDFRMYSSPLQKLPSPVSTIKQEEQETDIKSILILNSELQNELQKIFPIGQMDANEIHVVEYLNIMFPNEQSIAQSSKIIDALKIKRKNVDDLIRLKMKEISSEENNQVEREISKVKESMNELISRIQNIKEKAEDSERIVSDITRDIKKLDYGKRNLTTSITVLRRLQMLISTMDQLRGMASRKQFTQVSQLLQVCDFCFYSFSLERLLQTFPSFKILLLLLMKRLYCS